MQVSNIGPIQLLVVGFQEPRFSGRILRELRNVTEAGVIRLIDLQGVAKDSAGNVTTLEISDLTPEERARFGAVIGGLIGFGAAGRAGARAGAVEGAMRVAERDYGLNREDVREVLDLMPNDTAAMLALIEHHWAVGLKNAVRDAGGTLIAQGILTPEALVGLGAEISEAVEAAEEEPVLQP